MRTKLNTLLGCAVLAASASSAEGVTDGSLVLVPSSGWTDELREDLALGLEALPPAARAFPGGPLEVELHEAATAWGLGDDSHPAFSDGLRRLHLYDFRADDDGRAASPLARLSAEQQRRVWRRRAIVHAVIRRWDERLRWSSRAGWQGISGWTAGRPMLVYPWAYSRRLGMQSPELDLATFAEELLVPAESLAEEAVPPNERVRCRELSKSRYLDERLEGLDPSWKPRRFCPRFDYWANSDEVVGFEVAFTAPSTGSAQAAFGHLLLTVLRAGFQVPGSEQVMQFSALMSPFEPRGASYLSKGLTGGFRGVFTLSSMDTVLHEALDLEQRSVRRYRLDLSPEQRLRVLERMWELDHVGYIDYRFFDANCASMLRFLLGPALGADAPRRSLTPWETPTQVLDSLGPRLVAPELNEPTGERARRVSAQRKTLLATAPATTRAALGAAWHGVETLETADQHQRSLTYAALAGPTASPEDLQWRSQVLLASLRIERYALDVANVARLRAERATVLPGWKGPDTAELIVARQQRFEQNSTPRQQANAELDELLALEELVRVAPRRPPNEQEQQVISAEKETRQTFEAVSAAVAGLDEEALAAALRTEAEETRRLQDEMTARAVPEGGWGHGSVGGGVNQAVQPVLLLQAAVLRERLGDQRLRGFGARTEMHLLDGSLALVLAPSPVAVSRAGVTVFSTRAVGERGWGWGGGLDYAYEAKGHDVTVQAERLWAPLADGRFASYLLASAGLRAGLRVDPSAAALVVPRVALASRLGLPGSFGNAVRLEAAYQPRLRLGSPQVTFEQAVAGSAQLLVRLGVVGAVAVTARAGVDVEWRQTSGLGAEAFAGFEFD